MTMYQQDPDVVRWGLHLIDVCSLSNDGSPETLTCYEKDFSRTESVTEGYYNPTPSFVENDEVIAHTFQEELSRLASSDASGFTDVDKQNQKESILAQDWLGPSGRHSSSGFQCNQEEEEHQEPTLPNLEQLSLESEYQGILPEVEDETELDGELGKKAESDGAGSSCSKNKWRYTICGRSHIRSSKTSEQLYELTELKILGDGNCQFRSLSDQIYRTPDHHDFVREQIVSQLKAQPELYDNYVPMAYSDYLEKISKSGEWGDHVTLQAAADCYGIKIFVITSFKDTCYIEILPQTEKSNRIIFLSFWAEVHYNSIYPLGELPVVEEGKKKKRQWWT